MELSFSDVAITPAAADRWQQQVLNTIDDLNAAGVSTAPGTETLEALPDGRLRMTAVLACGVSIISHAEPHEWQCVTNN